MKLSLFQLWGGFDPSGNLTTVADEEEELVAYCTTATHGSRVIPPGALTGVQFIKTPDYVEVVGYIDQTKLNLQASDYGGEEDPHGADERGNPLGSLMFSSAFGNGTNSPYQQVHEWSYFVGGGVFCFKVCDPAGSRAAELCQHTCKLDYRVVLSEVAWELTVTFLIDDRIGCTYNDPASYETINGTFTSCLGEDQLPVGIYVSDGTTHTFTQPPESDGVINTVYDVSIPATSSCSNFTSQNLFTALASYHASVSGNATTSAPTSPATAAAIKAEAAKPGSASSSSTIHTGAAAAQIGGSAAVLFAVVMGSVAILA